MKYDEQQPNTMSENSDAVKSNEKASLREALLMNDGDVLMLGK